MKVVYNGMFAVTEKVIRTYFIDREQKSRSAAIEV